MFSNLNDDISKTFKSNSNEKLYYIVNRKQNLLFHSYSLDNNLAERYYSKFQTIFVTIVRFSIFEEELGKNKKVKKLFISIGKEYKTICRF